MRVFHLVLLGVIAGAATAAAAGQRIAPPWQKVIRDEDRKRLTRLYSAWAISLQEMRAAGQDMAAVAKDAPLPPEAAAAPVFPGPGTYRCRTLKLGSQTGGAAMRAGGFEACVVRAEAGGLRFEQLSGGRRIAGHLYADGDRMVFLGATALAQEMGVMAYGDDRDRDQVGVLRSIGTGRWRLELPWPKWESNLDLIEITATTAQPASDAAAPALPVSPPSAMRPAS